MLKGRHTTKTCVCRVSVFDTWQSLVFAMCLTSAHGKDNVIQHLLGSGTRGCTFAVCCPEAHGKDRCSPCAVPCYTANLDDIVRQPTTVSGSPRGTSFAVCRRVGTRRSLGSPCVLYAAHGESPCVPVSPCGFGAAHGKYDFHRVPEELHTAKFLAHGELLVSGSEVQISW